MIGYTLGQRNSAAGAVLVAPPRPFDTMEVPTVLIQHTPAPETEQEAWRPVVGYERLYEVSDLGRVRRIAPAKGARVGRVLSTPPNRNGYPHVGLCNGERQRTCLVHLLVAAAFLGPTPEGMEVNHIDTNRANPRPANLEFVTHQGNVQHMVAMGNSLAGERSPSARLTEADVIEIRRMRRERVPVAEVAARFGVSKPTICRVAKGYGWKHVPDEDLRALKASVQQRSLFEGEGDDERQEESE